MNGVLIIDKPQGVTSFDIVRQVRRLCGVRRVGHAGTLDPLATGVLPVAVGSATRLVEYMMAGDKTYQATLKLGASTDTQDSEGQTLAEKDWRHVDRAALDSAIAGFVGAIEQLPPMYSALKKDGQPLYKMARQGIEIERQPRSINIDSFVVDDFAPPFVTFTVRCSKGTYVRTLCHDLGQVLNCGAHLTALRRLSCGRFDAAVSHTLEELQDLVEQGRPLPFLSPAEVLADWPALPVAGAVLGRLRDGVAPAMTDLDVSGLVADDRVCFLADGVLIAVARFAPGGHGKRPGDFEIIKVFPPAEDNV
ncbi:MAG: tRNA pseudouridine(55) synthase TruB [Desulfuromonadales bacterium]|jgi:tRNA pseudouridine55 synthase|nr:tRNA pseudouridine(55) synthase TruB [Desulfuromonadales bacterium]